MHQFCKFRINVITKVRIIIKVRVTPAKNMPRQNTSSLLESDWCQWTASSRGLSHRRLPNSSAFSHCHWSPSQSLRTSVSKPNQIVIQACILKSVVIWLYLRPGTTCSVQRLHCTSQHNLTTCWLSSPTQFPAVLRHVSPSNNKVDIGSFKRWSWDWRLTISITSCCLASGAVASTWHCCSNLWCNLSNPVLQWSVIQPFQAVAISLPPCAAKIHQTLGWSWRSGCEVRKDMMIKLKKCCNVNQSNKRFQKLKSHC